MKCFYLSHWKDPMEVRINSSLTRKMKNHHFVGVRFLYNTYKRKFKGAILNYDRGMNYPWILQIFLTAVFRENDVRSPVLILTPENDIYVWHYHMKQIGVNVVLLKDNDCKQVFEDHDASIILASLNDLSVVHPYRNNKFEFVIVDQFDTVGYKMTFKKLSGNFNIALTNKNLMEDRDQKLLWTMLNWTNPHMFGKLADFYKNDRDHLQNLRDPYDEVWHRLSWNFCESFTKDTEQESETYKRAIDDWTASNKPEKFETSPQQKPSKRKLLKPRKNNTGKNRKASTIKGTQQAVLVRTQSRTNLTSDLSKRKLLEPPRKNNTGKNRKAAATTEIQQAVLVGTQSLTNLTYCSHNYSELLTVGKNVPTEKQPSKVTSIKHDGVNNNNFKETITEILTNSSENNNESLESDMHEKQKNLTQNYPTNGKGMENRLLLGTELLNKEDEITQVHSQSLEQTNSNFRDNPKLLTENIVSLDDDAEMDENPLLTAVIKGSPLKDLASRLIESSHKKISSGTEETDILLSIMEGTFSASQTEFKTENQNNTVPVSKCKNETNLLSFFDDNTEDLETRKRKHEFTESVSFNLRGSCYQPMLPLEPASDDFSDLKKSNYDIFESLFSIDKEICDYKMFKGDAFKLSNDQRNALITSLFEVD